MPGPNDASDQAALEVLRKCLFQFWQGSFHLFWGSARPPYSKFPALFVALHRRGLAFATLRIDENVGDEAGIFLATLKQTINLCPEWLDIDNWVNLWVSLSFGIIDFFPVRLHVALFYDPKDLKCLATQQTCLAVRYPGSCFHTTQTMHKSRQHMRQLCMRSVCTRRICVQFTLISRNPSKSYVGTGITIPCNNWNATTEIEAQQWEQASISWPHCDCLHPKTKKLILDGLDPSIEYLDPSSFKNVRLRLALLLYLSLSLFDCSFQDMTYGYLWWLWCTRKVEQEQHQDQSASRLRWLQPGIDPGARRAFCTHSVHCYRVKMCQVYNLY